MRIVDEYKPWKLIMKTTYDLPLTTKTEPEKAFWTNFGKEAFFENTVGKEENTCNQHFLLFQFFFFPFLNTFKIMN